MSTRSADGSEAGGEGGTGGERRPRADVARNRARLLAAARALFTERGDQVQLPDVARAAGVGMGTVYRHFPTREALVEAAAEDRFAGILAFARALADEDRDDPVLAYLHHVGEVLESDRGLSAAVEALRGTPGSAPLGRTRAELEEAVAVLIERARRGGTIRADATVADVHLLVGAISATVRTGSGPWRRLLDLTVQGLRPR
ncbi:MULTISPECIES: helix-turn-helix domain-containing protein [unclassified Kitasatospora]|uniref:TetR/AcrR family transcriptional regulator n=1 Tax=unclassified Kitasatospora TaxID=2633591 RepID=UPI0033EF6C4F